jgi:hypothetical protein
MIQRSMFRRNFIKAMGMTAAAGMLPSYAHAASERGEKISSPHASASDREYLWKLLSRIAAPVLESMSKGELHKKMHVEVSPTWDGRDKNVAYLECFGRLMDGLAPWLMLPDDTTEEGEARKKLREQALMSIVHAVDPKSPDYLLWRKEGQPLVDSAFFSSALLRAPKQLWDPLDKTTKERIVTELKLLRRVEPPYSNWLLFAAMNEAFLLSVDEDYDPMRVDLAVKKMNEWYVGDGWYADGERFHFDYYNSFVIQPMLLKVTEVMVERNRMEKALYEQALRRMQRYCEHLERLVSPEGTFPPIGRSLTYRTGAFQPLALLALRKQLPEKLTEGQVRAALVAVHQRIFSNPTNFNEDGFLTIGFAGHQPELGDSYSNNGSMYLTSESFLPLGLPANASFWTVKSEDWTAKKAFRNDRFNKDYPVNY